MNEEQLTSGGPEQKTEIGFHNLFKLEGKGVVTCCCLRDLQARLIDAFHPLLIADTE
jgi:hypothetical protein